ncbi:uncharacterized protein LOC135081276 isoform X2 [Ostrinia nubilalis]|uniref:uncharacterized protein LOC135081276 isoform X2 n=1 Tax=Ostrinia nubilalis TaxID=29057 RepID=UPI0030826B5C
MDFNPQRQSKTADTMFAVNYEPLPSLRELVSKDIVIDNKHVQDKVIPALISLQQVTSSDVQSPMNLKATTVDDILADAKVIAMDDIQFDEIQNVKTIIGPALRPLQQVISRDVQSTTNVTTTTVDNIVADTKVIAMDDILFDAIKNVETKIGPALKPLQQVTTSRDVQSTLNLTTTTVYDIVVDTKVRAMEDILFDEIKNVETKIVPALRSLQQVTGSDVQATTNRTTTTVDDIVADTKVIAMADIQFDEIQNVKTKIDETTTSKPNDTNQTTTVENSSDKKVLVSKFLKVDETNGDMKFSLVNEASDLTNSSSRKVFFAKPVVSNGTDLISMTGELNKPFVNQGSMSEEDYRPKDFSKSTFVGVPMSRLLPLLRSKTKSEGDNKNFPNIRKDLQISHGLPSSVVGYIKDNARNIGDIVFGGR